MEQKTIDGASTGASTPTVTIVNAKKETKEKTGNTDNL